MSETNNPPVESTAIVETESRLQTQPQPEVEVVHTDEAILDYTQRVRMGIVSELMPNGRVPDDKSSMAMLTQTLDGLDRQALGKMKIKVESEANNQLANATTMINELLTTVKTDMFTVSTPVQRVLPEIPVETVILVEETLVIGELDAGYREETVDEFKERYDATNESPSD